MKTNSPNSNKSVLNACIGRNQNLTKLANYAADSIVSKTILDKSTGTITLFAFDKGQKLSEHTRPYDAVVQIIEGEASITIGTENINISEGQIIIMPAKVPHSIAAKKNLRCY